MVIKNVLGIFFHIISIFFIRNIIYKRLNWLKRIAINFDRLILDLSFLELNFFKIEEFYQKSLLIINNESLIKVYF